MNKPTITLVNDSSLTVFPKLNELTLWTTKTRPVNYLQETSTRKNLHHLTGIYHADFLTAGNAKLDPTVLIFDMLAIDTCKNCSSCAATCYAMKAQRFRPPVFSKRAFNTWVARWDIGYLEARLVEQLAVTRLRTVRIHTAGDFFSQIYIDMWERITSAFPNIKFYFYTKVDHLFDFSHFTALDNVNMVRSVLPNGSRNYGTLEYCQELVERYGAVLCPYGVESMEPVSCGTECRVCMNNEFVVFKKH